ncbi:AAI domain-containing protein [Psidium guajava]|nr:AAI domain-containing protein [Psidium guajava]
MCYGSWFFLHQDLGLRRPAGNGVVGKILARGRKAAACWRSSISPRSLSGLASMRAGSAAAGAEVRSWRSFVHFLAEQKTGIDFLTHRMFVDLRVERQRGSTSEDRGRRKGEGRCRRETEKREGGGAFMEVKK